jgi:prephenate dehydrogenase
MDIAIIGNGRFGKYLKGQIERATSGRCIPLLVGENTHSIEEVTRRSVAVFCVPIRNFEAAWNHYLPYWQTGTALMDTCSVKSHPCDVMEQNDRTDLFMTGTHPLFGPQSAPNSCAGQRTAIIPVRGYPLQTRTLWETVLMTTPIVCGATYHDKAMSTQMLNHFIGRAAAQAGITRIELSTKTHELFMDIVDIVCANSPELFEDMNRFNPFAQETRQKFLEAANQLAESLNKQIP